MSAIFLFCNLMFLIIVSCIFIITFLTVNYTVIPSKILILSVNRIIILRSSQIFLTTSYTLIHRLLLFYLIRLVFNLIIHLSDLQIQIQKLVINSSEIFLFLNCFLIFVNFLFLEFYEM